MQGSFALTATDSIAATVQIVAPRDTLNIGGTLQLTDTVKTASGRVLTAHAVTWSASGGATVSATGVVTGAAAGNATITVSAMGNGVAHAAADTLHGLSRSHRDGSSAHRCSRSMRPRITTRSVRTSMV